MSALTGILPCRLGLAVKLNALPGKWPLKGAHRLLTKLPFGGGNLT